MPLMRCTINGKDGWKWGTDGVCFPGEAGKEKAAEVGKAIHAHGDTRAVLYDRAAPSKVVIDAVSGFMSAPVILARVGVQHYTGKELGLTKRAEERIGVLRSAEEVFNDDSVASFANLVLTDDHPSEMVTVDNVSKYQVGMVSSVSKVQDTHLAGRATITNKKQIAKIVDGKVQVSVGYMSELVQEGGTFDGVKYEYKQTNIWANHLAIVDAGRCGPACKLTLDKGVTTVKVQIGKITFDVENEQLAQAIQAAMADAGATAEELQAKIDALEEEKKKLAAAKDAAAATADAATKAQMTDEQINALVAARAKLLSLASLVLGDKMPDCADCPTQLKTLVVENVMPDMDLKDRSEAYLDAAFDMAVAAFNKSMANSGKLAQDFSQRAKTNDGQETPSREAIRQKYMADTLGL